MKLNPTNLDALNELFHVCHPLDLQMMANERKPFKFVVFISENTLSLERYWSYWRVQSSARSSEGIGYTWQVDSLDGLTVLFKKLISEKDNGTA